MNIKLCEHILTIFNKKDFINKWLSYKYKEKPLCIYGNPGIGKTTIAEYILKDWVKIYIGSEFCRNNQNLHSFLKESLYKKSITMMFNNNNVFKALIIDDISYIQKNDKKLFKSIVNLSKEHIKNHPIIYIFNNTNHKQFHLIIKKCFPFKLEYTENQFVDIIKSYLLKDKNIQNENIVNLLRESNYNFHNIIVNISFYDKYFKNIEKYDTIKDELSEHIKYIINLNNINDIYINSYSDYNIIGLNILENIPTWIQKKNISKKNKVLLIDKIYEFNIISDNLLNITHETNHWNFIDHIITVNIVSPIILLRLNKIEVLNIIYNKYISKCIIYIHNIKILTKYNITVDILSFLYSMIKSFYYDNNIDKNKLKHIIIKYINYYNIEIGVCEKFIKYFLKKINKNKIKIFY